MSTLSPEAAERRVFAEFCAAGLWPGLGRTLADALPAAGIVSSADVTSGRAGRSAEGDRATGVPAAVLVRGCRPFARAVRAARRRRRGRALGCSRPGSSRRRRRAAAARRSVDAAPAARHRREHRRPFRPAVHSRNDARRPTPPVRAGVLGAGAPRARRSHRGRCGADRHGDRAVRRDRSGRGGRRGGRRRSGRRPGRRPASAGADPVRAGRGVGGRVDRPPAGHRRGDPGIAGRAYWRARHARRRATHRGRGTHCADGVSVLTGGPGTGKSRTVAAIVALAERAGKAVELAAPTGRAAKRLEELCGAPASTIHRLLGAQGRRDEDGEAVRSTLRPRRGLAARRRRGCRGRGVHAGRGAGGRPPLGLCRRRPPRSGRRPRATAVHRAGTSARRRHRLEAGADDRSCARSTARPRAAPSPGWPPPSGRASSP